MLGDEDTMFRLSQKGLCSTICYACKVILTDVNYVREIQYLCGHSKSN